MGTFFIAASSFYNSPKKPFEKMSETDKESAILQAVDSLKVKLCKDGKWYADYVRIRGKAVKS